MGDLISITALATGMLFLLNPCSFALLPSYIGVFLNLDDETESTFVSIASAQKVSMAMAAGMLAVFLPTGLFLQQIQSSLGNFSYYLSIAIGLALVALGFIMILSELNVGKFSNFNLNLRLPKFSGGSNKATLGGMFLYGVSYAVAALGCSLPIVIVGLTAPTGTEGFVPRLGLVLSFSVGMVVALTTLTVAIATGKSSLVGLFRKIMTKMNIITGIILVPAGLYLIYYGWWSLEPVGRSKGPIAIQDSFDRVVRNWLTADVFDGINRAALLGMIFLAVNIVLALGGWYKSRNSAKAV